MREKYSFTDTLSCYPVQNITDEDMKFREDLEAACIVAANVNAKDMAIVLSDLKEATQSDPEYQGGFLKVQNKSFADTKNEEGIS